MGPVIPAMKVLVVVLLFAAVVSGGYTRLKRPEEEWRPAQPRDLSKYQPKLPQMQSPSRRIDLSEYNQWQVEKSHKKRNKMINYRKGWKSFDDICGIENPGLAKIVGGHETAENQWPWQVALFVDNAWFCGGSLISDEYVMTAGHCADGAGYFDIMAGAHNVRASSEPHRVEITSYEGFTHPDWNSNDLNSDIALVKLPSKITFNDYIRPACLPTYSDVGNDYVAEPTTPVGWGKNSDNAGGITPTLQMVEDLPVITNSQCAQYYGSIIYQGIVCIDSSGGKGVCNGDSGGTLNHNEGGNKWKQIGVTSFVSSAGCESGNPHGFTRVTHFLQWIETETGIEIGN